LDPTNPNDPSLLTFDESGYPKPAAPTGTWEHERAKTTIKRLRLDFHRLVKGRKDIWIECRKLIIEAENLMRKKPSATRNADLKNTFEKLRKMISVDAELSATAKACLLSSGILWVRNLV